MRASGGCRLGSAAPISPSAAVAAWLALEFKIARHDGWRKVQGGASLARKASSPLSDCGTSSALSLSLSLLTFERLRHVECPLSLSLSPHL